MLSVNQTRALNALLTCKNQTEAARVAGINPRTLRKYMTQTEFQAAYKSAVAELVADATRQAQRALAPAIAALKAIVENPEEPSGARISAARALLEYGLKLTEFNDVLKELRMLEGDINDAL